MPTIRAGSISEAWSGAASECLNAPGHEVTALTVEITLQGQLDSLEFRNRLNRLLLRSKRAEVETVARTIFPFGLWNPDRPREELYSRYTKILRKLRNYPLNRKGLYFERLIRYPQPNNAEPMNQLEFIIRTYADRKNHRRSALQASLYNPFLDATDSRRAGFPCLQQIAFVPSGGNDLTLVAFYPLHYIFERAYGNYLGLAYLGQFMAQEMRLRLAHVICVAGVAKLEVAPALVKSLKLERTERR